MLSNTTCTATERHLEWLLWGFLCFPDRCCVSVARADALKVALTHTLVQPLARDRWVMVHPLMSHHVHPTLHAFGKSLERASKERWGSTYKPFYLSSKTVLPIK